MQIIHHNISQVDLINSIKKNSTNKTKNM